MESHEEMGIRYGALELIAIQNRFQIWMESHEEMGIRYGALEVIAILNRFQIWTESHEEVVHEKGHRCGWSESG